MNIYVQELQKISNELQLHTAILNLICRLKDDTYIEDASGDKYVVRRSEMIYFKNKPCYCWAILKHSVGVTNASLSQ